MRTICRGVLPRQEQNRGGGVSAVASRVVGIELGSAVVEDRLPVTAWHQASLTRPTLMRSSTVSPKMPIGPTSTATGCDGRKPTRPLDVGSERNNDLQRRYTMWCPGGGIIAERSGTIFSEPDGGFIGIGTRSSSRAVRLQKKPSGKHLAIST